MAWVILRWEFDSPSRHSFLLFLLASRWPLTAFPLGSHHSMLWEPQSFYVLTRPSGRFTLSLTDGSALLKTSSKPLVILRTVTQFSPFAGRHLSSGHHHHQNSPNQQILPTPRVHLSCASFRCKQQETGWVREIRNAWLGSKRNFQSRLRKPCCKTLPSFTSHVRTQL